MGAVCASLKVFNMAEIDIVPTRDGDFIVAHDFTTIRTTLLGSRLWSEMSTEEAVGTPLLVPDLRGNSLAFTRESVVTLETLLMKAFETNPKATIWIDAHEKHTALLVAWLSQRQIYHNRTVVIFYTFGYDHGEEFAITVEQAGATANWRETIALMPNILSGELSRLAKKYPPNLESHFTDLVEAGKRWFTSIFAQKMRVVVAFLKIAGIGKVRVDDVLDPEGVEVLEASRTEGGVSSRFSFNPDHGLDLHHLPQHRHWRCHAKLRIQERRNVVQDRSLDGATKSMAHRRNSLYLGRLRDMRECAQMG